MSKLGKMEHAQISQNFEQTMFKLKNAYYLMLQQALRFKRLIKCLIIQNKLCWGKAILESQELKPKIHVHWEFHKKYDMAMETKDICSTNLFILNILLQKINLCFPWCQVIDSFIAEIDLNTDPWTEHWTLLPNKEKGKYTGKILPKKSSKTQRFYPYYFSTPKTEQGFWSWLQMNLQSQNIYLTHDSNCKKVNVDILK